jgi:hypothetical protein
MYDRGNMMKREKIDSEIKDLNSTRAMYHKEFMSVEKKYHDKKISKKDYEKYKRKYELKNEKIKSKIRLLEEKMCHENYDQ